MNQRVYDSKLLRNKFNIRSIRISYTKSVANLGTYSLRKVIIIVAKFFILLKELLFHRPRFVYFQISPLGVAFYRDLVFVSLIKLFNVKIVYHLHGKGIKQAAKNRRKRSLYKYAFSHEELICVSRSLTNDVEDVFSGAICLVNNGIPDIENHYVIDNAEDKRSANNILFLSNLIFSKGILDYIDALQILHNNGINFNGLIIGAEADLDKNSLYNLLVEKKIADKVKYFGALYGNNKNEIIAKSDVLVFPTKNDIWGNVILEAMQHKKPVISTFEGAIPEIIDDGITGFLVNKSSPEQIAGKIQLLIENHELRRSMGIAARKKYEEKYTLSHFENNLKAVFEDILTKKQT